MNDLARLILNAKNILVFTGAGISTESGISDYRSKGGLWDRFQPVTIQEFLASQEKRVEYWQIKLELYHSLQKARPNNAHKAILAIEKMNKLKGIITQNIDGLHQMAGSDPGLIVELHGNNRETICLSCGEISEWQIVYRRLQAGETAPLCKKCQGFLKPNTISFGQSLVTQVLNTALKWSKECDLLLALGSTLVVEPAASIPRLAKQNGAQLVIITLSETPLDGMADLKIEAKVGECMRLALQALSKQSENN